MGGDSNIIVGRVAEIARMRGALDAARAGRSTVVAVVGPPGIGKTSLWRAVFETRPNAVAGQLLVLTAGSRRAPRISPAHASAAPGAMTVTAPSESLSGVAQGGAADG